MEEVEINTTDFKKIDIPWCHECQSNTPYINSWDSIQRANLDGGTYGEIVDIRKCIECGNEMVLIKDYKNLIRGINVIGCLIWVLLLLVWIFLIPLKSYLAIGILFNSFLIFLIWLLTKKHRRILNDWKKSDEIEKITNLKNLKL